MQRRRSDTAHGGLPYPKFLPLTVEKPEVNNADNGFFGDTMECMNPWYEPGSYFYYDHGINAAQDTAFLIHLEL